MYSFFSSRCIKTCHWLVMFFATLLLISQIVVYVLEIHTAWGHVKEVDIVWFMFTELLINNVGVVSRSSSSPASHELNMPSFKLCVYNYIWSSHLHHKGCKALSCDNLDISCWIVNVVNVDHLTGIGSFYIWFFRTHWTCACSSFLLL